MSTFDDRSLDFNCCCRSCWVRLRDFEDGGEGKDGCKGEGGGGVMVAG